MMLLPLSPAQGWMPFLIDPPPMGVLCLFRNELNGSEWTAMLTDYHPAMVPQYVWWKLSGIARMDLEAEQ
jgi:hypothetical protein